MKQRSTLRCNQKLSSVQKHWIVKNHQMVQELFTFVKLMKNHSVLVFTDVLRRISYSRMRFFFKMCFHFQNVKGFVSVVFLFSEKHNCKQKSVYSLQIALLMRLWTNKNISPRDLYIMTLPTTAYCCVSDILHVALLIWHYPEISIRASSSGF